MAALVQPAACSRSPGCACSMCGLSVEALLLATPQPKPPRQKENRPPARPTARREAPVVPAKVGAMELPAPKPAALTLRTASAQVGAAAIKAVDRALAQQACSRSPGCACPLCDTSAEAMHRSPPPPPAAAPKPQPPGTARPTPPAKATAVFPIQTMASKPVVTECTRSPGCSCPLCDTSAQAMLRSPPPAPAPKMSARTSSKDAPTRLHPSGAMPRPRHPSGKPTITPIKARPQPTRGPGSEAAQAVLARIKAQAALALNNNDSSCPVAVAAARAGDESVLLAALAATSTSVQWSTIDDVLAKMQRRAPGGVTGRATPNSLATLLESTPSDVLAAQGIWVTSSGRKHQPIVITNSAYAIACAEGRTACSCGAQACATATPHQPTCPAWEPPTTSKLHSQRRGYSKKSSK
jgi:hypothetical protein